MTSLELQKWAIRQSLKNARCDLVKAKQAQDGQPDNTDWQEWVEEAANTIKGLESALETIEAFIKIAKVLK